MRKYLMLGWLLTLLFCLPALAQEVTVSGRVTSSDDGSALPGVSIQIKGTSRGTTTDSEGRYRLSVPANARLVFSYIGFGNQEIAVGNQTTIDVALTSGAQNLSEIVVTAQGIERDKRSLGYSTQEVNSALISQKSEPNLLNSLQGKLAGVNISTQSGSPGASTNINIRGITSFNGSNQPLIVVDGIIFSNDVNVTGNTLFQSQSANRLADINPESIESINVLKGPAAAVLYGSRASAGAIIITTKTGRNQQNKTEVTITSSYNVQEVYGLPRFQNDYGQGTNNLFVNNTTNSWGPAFVGGPTSVTNLQGQVRPYQAYPNNVRDFYRQGHILQNTANIAGGDVNRNFNISVSNTAQQGITLNSKFSRTNVQLGGETRLNNGLRITGTGTYAQTVQRGATLGNGGSAFGQLTRIPRSYDLPNEPYQDANGQSIYFVAANNPYWSLYNSTLDSQVDRFFGNFTLGYDVTKWLNITYRATGDTYTDRRKAVENFGAARAAQGSITQDNFFRSELNGDLLITAKTDRLFLEGLGANLLLGNNINQRRTQNVAAVGASLVIPGFLNTSNGSVLTGSGESSTLRRLVGYYAQLSLNYQNYLFLELTGRADQSSTLPKANSTYFYPSASLSFVPTDFFKVQSDILSYAKVRASIARVGRDADPYLLNSVYVPSTYGNNLASVTFPLTIGGSSVPGFTPSSRIGSNALTPEFVTSSEVGLNLGFFQNRLSLDAAYFFTRSTDQIFNVAISNSTGFDTRTTNVGELQNQGIELVLSATPVRVSGFKWDITANFTRIRNKVISIAPGVRQSGIAGNGFIGITASIVEGQPYGVIVSTANTRVQNTNPNDPATYDPTGQYVGQYIINPTSGQFAPGLAGQVIANPNPNYTLGINNSFSYKGFTLQALVDIRQGGQLFSFPAVDYRSGGQLYVTGIDRDQPRILPGVIPITGSDGRVTGFRPNNIQLSSQAYWQGLGGLASEAAVFDATNYRLREVSLNYTLPKGLLNKTPFGTISVGVSGRNLFFYAPNYYTDPEVNTQGAGNIQGLDLNGPPNARNYGVNLRLTL
ncbi:SusC/RagA family TonB-linked outer membrane protein [Fibrisoma montanum]|uniref:SusC/RagA family TonB-linked outer membrane protein n=1 Tax=Fibrisoma montanum TaxID=2305895 RepID=A0A418M0Z7_9BACT|nr:SusC/RagA family TonB-linked outer membrane protein [Fibrisoma montanum]RIV19292.1 SusC/RagA family TonB-linked outer membrane protein [Fibrisoma montanum]